MNIQPVLLFCFISALSGFVSAQVIFVTGTEGQGVTVRCHFSLSASRKFFCKGGCEEADILIETSERRAQKGRYTIECQGTLQSAVLFVTIKPLTKSDTGHYKCGMSGLFINSQQMVDLTVKAAPTTSSTSSTPSVTLDQAPDQVAGYFLPLVVCVPVVVLLLAAVLLFLYKKKKKRKFNGLNTNMNVDDGNMKGSHSAKNVHILQSLSFQLSPLDGSTSTH